MALPIDAMQIVCIAHYVERNHDLAHAKLIVGNKEDEIRYCYEGILKERQCQKHCEEVPHPIADLNIIEIVDADKEATAN